ncbi:MAG: anion permease [Kiritimatiellae bacterium]|nr:anion permease [Kiritimatiellia bacterium]
MPTKNGAPARRVVFLQFAAMAVVAAVMGWLASLLPAPASPSAVYPDLAGAASPERLLSVRQIAAVAVFSLIICATLMFEERRLGVAFVGISALLALKVLTLSEFVHSTELHIILLLVGMMTLVGALKDMGLFTWIIQSIVNAKRMTGFKFVAILMLLSGIMPGIVDEVTSIVFVLALVFQVCDTLKLRPTPFVLMSVMATNIGSTGTMLGNPVGILIGTKATPAPLSFGDFIIRATPITLLSLVAAFLVLLVYFRRDIRLLDERLAERRASHIGLGPMVEIPYRRGLAILLASLAFIAAHHPLEHALGLEANTMLVAAPLTIAGLLMVFRSHRARHYVESSIEWWSLLFFMMLFAVSFALEHCGVTEVIAEEIAPEGGVAPSMFILTPLIVAITAIGSAFVDNIVFVSTFIPIIKTIVENAPSMQPLWWALLFGACFGGNITAIGSTANLVAISMLGKRYSLKVAFLEWLKVGLLVGAVSCAVATGVVLTYFRATP